MTKEKVSCKLGNSKYTENTFKILRMRPVHPMEKQASSSLKRVKTRMKILQSKTKVKEITNPCRLGILIHLLLGVKLKQSF